MAFSSVGHAIWVFEGHPSALAAGLTESEFLLVDSAMLPFLQSDWMQAAQRVMRADGRVFIHKREGYQLLRVVPSAKAPGWQYSEPDGEGSYVNCLLTTLAKGPAASVEIDCAKPVPGLVGLASDPDELDWIADLPFRYEALDARRVFRILMTSSGGLKNWFKTEWTFNTLLISGGQEPKKQIFVFRVRNRWSKKAVLEIRKS